MRKASPCAFYSFLSLFRPPRPLRRTILSSLPGRPPSPGTTPGSIREAGRPPIDVWPVGLSGAIIGGQSTPAYSDVQRVSSLEQLGVRERHRPRQLHDGAVVSKRGEDGSLSELAVRQRTPNPLSPAFPAVATTHKTSGGGPIAMAVNGVVFFNGQDAFSYSHASATELMAPQGDGIWNRDALGTESVTFDPTLAHQQQTGQYHYHVNPIGLRYQMNDHVTYNALSGVYAEATTTLTHSPILGWAFDGYPIYGPYGYSSPLSITSPVRRMVSGFVPRDGTHGTTNLAVTGRLTLPNWAVAAQGRTSAVLTSTQTGPAVTTARPLGYYQEDNDYLGDEGYTQGVDFDLNQYNARFCVTPQFPQGTWAYFVTIDGNNAPYFPYAIGPQYEGVATGGAVTAIAEPVTEYIRGGAAAPIAVTVAAIGTAAVVSWASVEGGSYLVEDSNDGSTWTTLASNVASGGTTTSYSTASVETYYRVTLSALATYATAGSGAVTAVGGTATGQLVGSTGTAYLTNLSTLVPVGGKAGAPAVGMIVSGTGSKDLLVRAIGPTLKTFGLTGVLADPTLTAYEGSIDAGTVSGWTSDLSIVFASVGAFALPTNSADAAIEVPVPVGTLSGTLGSVSGGSGTALLEVYDTSPGGTPTLANLSARAFVAAGSSVSVGFVIGGTGTMQVLLRGVGPALSGLGVSGVLADPALTVYSGSAVIASNVGWSSAANASAIAAAATAVGAFSLTSGSKDSAQLVTPLSRRLLADSQRSGWRVGNSARGDVCRPLGCASLMRILSLAPPGVFGRLRPAAWLKICLIFVKYSGFGLAGWLAGGGGAPGCGYSAHAQSRVGRAAGGGAVTGSGQPGRAAHPDHAAERAAVGIHAPAARWFGAGPAEHLRVHRRRERPNERDAERS